MNRYSLIFALMVASSFAVHPPQAGDRGTPAAASHASAAGKARGGGILSRNGGGKGSMLDDPVELIQTFLEKAAGGPKPGQSMQVLFATVPHPVETHLASAFDHNVDALQDGLQESGYLFDSSWIPWNAHQPREQFDDDEREKIAGKLEDESPGILLFRQDDISSDPYRNGIIVFLLSEKPTEGIAYSQVQTAWEILQRTQIRVSEPIRILGPTYSGSIDSLEPIIAFLHGENQAAEFLIRSGGVTGGVKAVAAMRRISNLFPQTSIDFGSAHHDYWDWLRAAVSTLNRMSIDCEHTVILNEGESLFGGLYEHPGLDPTKPLPGTRDSGDGSKKHGCTAGKDGVPEDVTGMWSLAFPRDISSLRADYEQQGIFDTSSPAQPWKRVLNLKSDDRSEGDSVRSFGGAATVAAQESVLFGISEFLKAHGIRAAIVSATNEDDRYFLTQFLHAHNGGVRVVVIGNTRIFLRGSTAQFRGDMMVDDFPMFPRLHDWTDTENDRVARVFADYAAQGTYFAAIDLFKMPEAPAPAPENSLITPEDSGRQFKWYPEYSEPYWDRKAPPVQRPPMYVAALGSNSTWPVAEYTGTPLEEHPGLFRAEMPFTLFKHDLGETPEAPIPPSIQAGHYWKDLFWVVFGLAVFYCACFWFANPMSRTLFASFEPSLTWRFWLFKVTIPAAAAGCAFLVMAWAVEMPSIASTEAPCWWRFAESMTVLAPLGIAAAAASKALLGIHLSWTKGMLASFLPTIAAAGLCISKYFVPDPFAGRSVGEILNTYREMHWESGLSLVPTWLLFLLAILIWSAQAGNGGAQLAAPPVLPEIPRNARISQGRAKAIHAIGLPLPFNRQARWIWTLWIVFAAAILVAHLHFSPFLEITTLETSALTNLVRGVAGVIGALIFLDVLQFLGLWIELRGLLQALDRQRFKRGFVPIHDFNWRRLWSFSGVSLHDRRAINDAQIDCVLDLARGLGLPALGPSADKLAAMRDYYNCVDPGTVSRTQFLKNREDYYDILAEVGTDLALRVESPTDSQSQTSIPPDEEARQEFLSQAREGGGRFSDEAEEFARLPEWQQAAERLICLMYIGLIQTVVARLHTLLVSVASMFSLVTLGVAIYPFVPSSSLLLAALALLLLIGCAFFKVFSEMDSDPVLSRIVSSDGRKGQGNFYLKFAEALALPLLTLGSTLLPGGAGRLLELAQAFLNHQQ